MSYSGSRPRRESTVERTDARALPQFRAPSDRPAAGVDESEVVETLERPSVRIRRVPVTPPRTKAARPVALPPITSEVEAQDILLEAYAEPEPPRHRPRPALPSAHSGPRSVPGPRVTRPTLPPPSLPAMRSPSKVPPSTRASKPSVPPTSPLPPRAPAAHLRATIPGVAPPPLSVSDSPPSSKSPRKPPPPLPPADAVEVICFSSLSSLVVESDRSLAAAPDLGARIDLPQAEPLASAPPPPSPITRPMLPPAHAFEVPIAPPVHRPPQAPSFALPSQRATLETTPSLAPVAMSASVAPPSRAADPTMQLRRQPRRSAGLVAAVAIVAAAALAGSVVALVAVLPDTLGGPSALVDRLKGRVHDEPRAPVVAPPPSVAAAAPAPAPVETAAAPAAAARAAPAPAAPAPSTVPVDALPKSDVEPHLTLVTLPRSSKGHRIFVDGRVVGSGPAPMKIKCGTHKIKIGSAGKPRIAELPCGGELTLD